MANFRNENKCATVKSMLKTERKKEEWRVIISQRGGLEEKRKKQEEVKERAFVSAMSRFHVRKPLEESSSS